MSQALERTISHTFCIDAALALNQTSVDYPHRALHGHRFEIRLVIRSGSADCTRIDALQRSKLDAFVSQVRDALHLRCLNDVPGLTDPTVERLALWLDRQLRLSTAFCVKEIRIQDTASSCVILETSRIGIKQPETEPPFALPSP